MKELNWAVGVKRLYFVAWAIWFIAIGMSVIEGATRIGDIFTFLGVGVVVPYAILKAGQWVYSGMRTKQQ